jgi:hypothetical protein
MRALAQLLDEAGAAAATTTTDLWSSNLQADRTQLVVETLKSRRLDKSFTIVI